MAQVAVGKGVRCRLEPHDDGVHLGQCANQRVVDVVVDDKGRGDEGEGDVEGVNPGDDDPGGVELLAILRRRACGTVLDALPRPEGLSCGGEFNEVGSEEMARNQEVEEAAEEDVLSAVCVAPYAYQDAILRTVSDLHMPSQYVVDSSLTFCMFSIMSLRLPTTVGPSVSVGASRWWARDLTQDNDHEVPEPDKAGRRI